METLPILTVEEKHRAVGCVNNILDKMNAVQMEVNKEQSFKYYMEEKLESILWDVNCLLSMCKRKGE